MVDKLPSTSTGDFSGFQPSTANTQALRPHGGMAGTRINLTFRVRLNSAKNCWGKDGKPKFLFFLRFGLSMDLFFGGTVINYSYHQL